MTKLKAYGLMFLCLIIGIIIGGSFISIKKNNDLDFYRRAFDSNIELIEKRNNQVLELQDNLIRLINEQKEFINTIEQGYLNKAQKWLISIIGDDLIQ